MRSAAACLDEKPAGFALIPDPGATVTTKESAIQIGSRKVTICQLRAKDSPVYRLRFARDPHRIRRARYNRDIKVLSSLYA